MLTKYNMKKLCRKSRVRRQFNIFKKDYPLNCFYSISGKPWIGTKIIIHSDSCETEMSNHSIFFVKLLIFQIHSSTPMIFQLKSNYQNVHKSLSELKYEEMTKALFKPNKVLCCKLKLFRNFPTLLQTANNCVWELLLSSSFYVEN